MTSHPEISPLRSLGLSVYLPSAFMAVGQMALLVILPIYIVEGGGGVVAAALVFAMRGFGSMLVNVPAGLAIARWGHRATMLSGTGLMGVSAVMIATASSHWVVAGATLMFGAGMGAWLLARLAYITEQVPNWQRGAAMSGLAGLQRLGVLLGPFVGGIGVEYLGYSAVFLAISVIAWITVLLLWLFAPPGGAAHQERDGRQIPCHGYPATVVTAIPTFGLMTLVPSVLRRHRKVFLSAGVFVFCLQLLREQRRLLVVLWGTSIGVGVEEIGFIVSIAAVADMAMFPIAGYIMDHWGRKVAGLSCIGILSVALGLLPLTSTVMTYLLATVIGGVGNGLGSGIILTMGSDIAPPGERSQFLGVWRMVGDLGALVGPLMTSITASIVAALGFSMIVGLGGGLVLLICVDETLSSRVTSKIGEPDGCT